MDPALNPAQAEVLALLGARPEERPTFDAELRNELRHALNEGLEPLIAEVTGDKMFINKRLLAMAMGCERRLLADDDTAFAWSVPIARGTIAHKAIELSIHWQGQPEPLDLVDQSIARLAEGTDGLAYWLQACSEVERAELRALGNDHVAQFLECWPPLKTQWRPLTESKLRLELHHRFVLSGKVDLTLGRAEGTTAGKVLIDFKTGGAKPDHVDDLRFYALIETIRLGTPPRRIATYYLDQGQFVPEDVTENLLFSAAARVIDGITTIVELRTKIKEAGTSPGPACGWCPALVDCDVGRLHREGGAGVIESG